MSNEGLVTMVEVDGRKGVNTPVGAVAFDDMLNAIHGGFFGEAAYLIPHVVKAYLAQANELDPTLMLPILRYFMAWDALEWVEVVSGGPTWTYGDTTIEVDVTVLRVAFAAQIESSLATQKDGRSLEWRASKLYEGMRDWENDGLNQFGKDVVADILNSTVKAHANGDYQRIALH